MYIKIIGLEFWVILARLIFRKRTRRHVRSRLDIEAKIENSFLRSYEKVNDFVFILYDLPIPNHEFLMLCVKL